MRTGHLFHLTLAALICLTGGVGARAAETAAEIGERARTAGGDTLAAAGSADNDLKAALEELAALQERIGAEKIPLAKRMNDLEAKVLALRSEYDRAQRNAENQLVELNVLRADVKVRRNEIDYLQSLLQTYLQRWSETRLHVSELPLHEKRVAETKATVASADVPTEHKLASLAGIVQSSLDRLRDAVGGAVYGGQALTDKGTVEQGKFVAVGPVVVFASDNGSDAGLAKAKLNAAEPAIVNPGAAFEAGVVALASTSSGQLPFDATMGNAEKMNDTKESIAEHIGKGGPVMVPILLLGLTAAIISVVKYLQLSRIHSASPQQLQLILSHIRNGENDKAAKKAEAIKGPVGEMLQTAIGHVGEKKEYIEEVMYERMLTTKPRLEKLIPIIALASATAPLLGLLGTVTGMINTFKMITVFGTGDPKTLAGGISEALITTEFGLIVAVPSLLMHAFVSRKAKGILGSMEQTTVGFVNGVPAPIEERMETEYADGLLK